MIEMTSISMIMRSQALFALLAVVGVCAATGAAADPNDPRAAAAPSSRVSVLTGEQVVQILDETVDWYRTLGTQQQNVTQPSDLLILYANRQTADKVVGLAFEIARANAELLSSEAASAQSAADGSSPQALNQRQNQLDAQRQSIQQEIDADRQKLAAASGKDKQVIEATLQELQGELAMANARKNLLDTMTEFVAGSDPKAAGATALKAQIDAIAATIPASSAAPASASSPVGSSSAAGTTVASAATSDGSRAAPARYGVWDLATAVLRQRTKIKTIDLIGEHTAALAQTFSKISEQPLKQLTTYAARSDALAAQADNASSGALKDLRNEFDTLAWLFKQTSDILVPLTKESVLLRQYQHNLGNWRESAQRQYHEALSALAVRSGIVAGILAIVFVLAEAWRRAVLRYAHEPRRRYQLLLIRTIVLWTVVTAVVGLSFVTEISTFATFAGLLTAGLAVAMQSVLVSVVGYFFLIGKYGIRVGDRIQIGAVVGEVIDLGLVRMHLMELNQQGPLGPTGRVVAFANLIVFQASGGLFKQIPGVNLSWHETTLTLPAVSDYAALKDKLLAAIRAVLNQYSEEIVRQTKEIERTTATTSVNDATPQVQMHLSNGKMEALIRYPVHLQHAAEIDERVAQAVLKVIAESAEPT
jgi:small-conductance mechanosensitive channel